MSRTLISETPALVGQKVTIKGWVNSIRSHGQIVFADIRDRSGLVQIVGDKKLAEIKDEYVVEISGLVKSRDPKYFNEKLVTGKVEIEAKKITVLAKAEEMPVDIHQPELNATLPVLLDYRTLSFRHPKVKAIFKVEEVVVDSFRQALKSKDFMEFQSPSIIPSVPEGGAEVFKVDYFGHQAYLSQSPQLYKSLLVSAFERVFSVNKIFRAEPSVTTRHLTEVVSLDAEMGLIESWEEVRDMAEYVIKFVLNNVKDKCAAELALFNATTPAIPPKIPSIKLRDAQQIIFERTGRDCRQEKDLAPEDEREICKWSFEKYGSELVFVTHFPTKFRPFYTYPDDENPEFNQGFDLIGRGVEWLTGGRRIHDYQMIMDHVKKWGIDPAGIDLYLQAFRYGMPPLGGFAFGAERITMQVLNLANIREASLFPRDMERIDSRLSTIGKKNTPTSSNLHDKLIAYLKEKDIKFKHLEHQPTHTSEESAQARGTSLKQGAKALVMFADNHPILVVLSAAHKLNNSAFKTEFKVKDLRMATPDEVQQVSGVGIGAVPPFGNLFNTPVYVDQSLLKETDIAFNAGSLTNSIIMRVVDFVKLVNPQSGNYAE
jgi:nondiscriminating aspartyl-tRNA synthetase